MILKQATSRFIKDQLQHHTPKKLKGYEFYEKVLGSPKYIVAPMVEQSELSWRKLCRKYDAHLCYTPMFHARLFSDPDGHKYREEQWSTDDEDRPLIVQFCANDPDVLLRAAKMVENDCDAVDLNLGCPQKIARNGRYGSYLQDDWETVYKLISTLDRELRVPVTAKIRVFESTDKTTEYAKMIQSAGAQLLTVHGRLREQKGQYAGLADWNKIKAVKKAIDIPVIANGNILYNDCLQECLDQTGVDGVMSAEGVLYNPALFQKREVPPLTYQIALEYIDICKSTPTRPSIIKSHLFKLFHVSLSKHTDLRDRLIKSTTFAEMEQIALEFRDRLDKERQIADDKVYNINSKIRTIPPWRCQPNFKKSLERS